MATRGSVAWLTVARSVHTQPPGIALRGRRAIWQTSGCSYDLESLALIHPSQPWLLASPGPAQTRI
jgi:hypothetical protein